LLPTSDASPTATSTYVYTPTPIPTATLAPGETPTEEPTATEEATSEPTTEATTGPTGTPLPTSTPITEADYNTQFDELLANGATFTGLSKDQIKAMWLQRVKDDLIRTKVGEKAEYHIEDTKTLVHAAHILVATEDEAKQVIERINKGEEFEKLAAELSTDTSNALKGGDLGWLKHGDTVEEFEKVAFATEPGKISAPVQSQFGWHVIKVYDKAEEPADASDKENQKQEQFSQMLKDWRNAATVNIDDSYPTYIPTLPGTSQQ
jgi:parvulin-like peptidyl-prolyl isomerase